MGAESRGMISSDGNEAMKSLDFIEVEDGGEMCYRLLICVSNSCYDDRFLFVLDSPSKNRRGKEKKQMANDPPNRANRPASSVTLLQGISKPRRK